MDAKNRQRAGGVGGRGRGRRGWGQKREGRKAISDEITVGQHMLIMWSTTVWPWERLDWDSRPTWVDVQWRP